jgi:hypothetical protein
MNIATSVAMKMSVHSCMTPTIKRRALLAVATTSVLCLMGSSFTAAASLTNAGDCAGIKHTVQTAGRDVYRYRDPQHPSLQLYTLYVRSDLQCNVGEALEQKPVPSLDGCFEQTCVVQNDYGED